jgi:hypothetical protein
MEYFTDYGGYTYTLQFISKDKEGRQIDSVAAASELSFREPCGSYFRLTNDDGPVLSFDTYNSVLHHFARPSSEYYQGKGGDFEFLILSATEEEVVLKGKRCGYITKLHPIQSGDILSYAKSVSEAADGFMVLSASGFINGERAKLVLDLGTRQMDIYSYTPDGYPDEENKVTLPFLVTGNGIRFSEEIEAFGTRFISMSVNKSNTKLAVDGTDYSLNVDPVPAGYSGFSDYPGEYKFTYMTGTGKTVTANVTLAITDQMNKVIKMTGFSSDYEGFDLTYDPSRGCLNYIPQYVGKISDTEYVIAFTSDGTYSYKEAKMSLVADGNGTFLFKDYSGDGAIVKYIILFRDYEAADKKWYYEQYYGWSPALMIPKSLERL